MRALLLLPLFLTACGSTRGGYTLKFNLGYNGMTAGVEYTPPVISPEPPLPDSPTGKQPVSILLP